VSVVYPQAAGCVLSGGSSLSVALLPPLLAWDAARPCHPAMTSPAPEPPSVDPRRDRSPASSAAVDVDELLSPNPTKPGSPEPDPRRSRPQLVVRGPGSSSSLSSASVASGLSPLVEPFSPASSSSAGVPRKNSVGQVRFFRFEAAHCSMAHIRDLHSCLASPRPGCRATLAWQSAGRLGHSLP
jgi:hypothetical protein